MGVGAGGSLRHSWTMFAATGDTTQSLVVGCGLKLLLCGPPLPSNVSLGSGMEGSYLMAIIPCAQAIHTCALPQG
jgi:hypothetical protein